MKKEALKFIFCVFSVYLEEHTAGFLNSKGINFQYQIEKLKFI